ncbi:hypothetical protein [Photobacterium sp. 1_MG-2023]|uniref:hypothetical protein n=1 Tax=Photobacterium sp. 1_MG-2023 TaxID=3062646 RepID=UPI0026E43AE0|nr:hypothetical protein [Photobacterium sp. 1_MG-2023]MDO6706922.1 hypothetical protein [Photobacterium sp. 1_MG-2023]
MKKRCWPAVLMLSLSSCFFTGIAHARQSPVQVPGTAVTMSPPDGFVVAQQFSGFAYPGTNASILLAEIPSASFTQLTEVFADLALAKKAFAPQGIDVKRLLKVNHQGKERSVLVGVQRVNGVDVGKYMVLVPGQSGVLLTYNIVPIERFSEQSIVASIASVTMGDALSAAEKAAALDFSFQMLPPFHLADVMTGSTAILTSFAGVDPSGKKPLISVGRSLTATAMDDPKLFSERLVNRVAGFEKAEVIHVKPVHFAGLEGFRVEAINQDRTLIQYTGFEPNGAYFRLIAVGSTQALAEISDTIDQIAQSVKKR